MRVLDVCSFRLNNYFSNDEKKNCQAVLICVHNPVVERRWTTCCRKVAVVWNNVLSV